MSEKTILKLYPNGNFETVNTVLHELDNLFIKTTSNFNLWLSRTGILESSTDPDIVSDFIEVTPNTNYTLQVWTAFGQLITFSGHALSFYDSAKNFISFSENYPSLSYNQQVYTTPSNARYVRMAVAFGGTDLVQIQFSKGNTTNKPYNLSMADRKAQGLPLYSFAENLIIVPPITKNSTSSVNPIKFYKESVVIKGNLIQS